MSINLIIDKSFKTHDCHCILRKLKSYWRNQYDLDGNPKIPPFGLKLYRQVAFRHPNDVESINKNAKNVWKSRVSNLNKEFETKYLIYVQKTYHMQYLLLVYANSKLKIVSNEIIEYISEFI